MFGRKKSRQRPAEETGRRHGYDFSTREGRETTAGRLFQAAAEARTGKETEWKRYNDYYNFIRDATDEMKGAREESGINFTPAVVPDPFIAVESQLDPAVPEPQFVGRDDDLDSAKAKKREFAVRYILQANDVASMNTANERRLKKLGDAFWKAYWDDTMRCGPYLGDIRVRDVPVEAVYVDPSAGADGLQAGQYVAYLYRVHWVRFWQMYGEDLRRRGVELEDIMGSRYREESGLFDLFSGGAADDETVEVMEFWFRQPFPTKGEEGETVPAGAVACSVQAGGHEVKYIPNYWRRTGGQQQLFPFVHYWCVRDENEFYNKPELFPVMGMVDAADRALATGQLNDAMMANDIVVREEGALADGCEIENVPGAEVVTKPGKLNAVRRLGGLHDGVNSLAMVQFMLGQIERANRNYDTNRGKESARVTTASGLAQLRGDADTQAGLKKADRNAGFKRLFELLDWLALEYYDEPRLLFLGAKKEGEEARTMLYYGDSFAQTMGGGVDPESGEVLEGWTYWPVVDVTVNAGDGIVRSKAATLETLDKLSAIQVTAENWRLLSAELEILDIPQKQEIVERWRQKFEPTEEERLVQALRQDPELMGLVAEAVGQRQGMGQELQADAALPGAGPGDLAGEVVTPML